jgi:quercetin dioxygenase-like cupin family protein
VGGEMSIEKLESDFERIKELTEKITRLEDFTRPESKKLVFNLPDGINVICEILKDEKEFVIIQGRFPKGCLFPLHSHAGSETLTVLAGQITCYIEDNFYILKVGDALKIYPDTQHWCKFDEETDIVSITIPREEAFSNGRH